MHLSKELFYFSYLSIAYARAARVMPYSLFKELCSLVYMSWSCFQYKEQGIGLLELQISAALS